MTESNRENWTGRLGFILTTAGFAIGLGNIWRFPYKAGENGGGAFLFIYLVICFFVGIPLLITEVTLGRKARMNPVGGMRLLGRQRGGRLWVVAGWSGMAAATLVMSYYIMITSWMFYYFFMMLSGRFQKLNVEESTRFFDEFTGNPGLLIALFLFIALILGVIVSRGIQKGVEKISKIFLPLTFLFLLILAVRSVTLPGAGEGLRWYLMPRLDDITPLTFVTALGQAFFSIGIGVGTAYIYGSYLKQESDLVGDSILVVIVDTTAAVLAGIIIFPALFAFGFTPQMGPELVYVTMPVLFSQLPGGLFFGSLFFLSVTLAGLTPGIGYLESVASTLAEEFNLKKGWAVVLALSVMFLLGLASIFSFSLWSKVRIFSLDIFDLVDYLSGNVLMPLTGALLIYYAVVVWRFEYFSKEANRGAKKIRITSKWKPLFYFVVPVSVTVITLASVLGLRIG